EPALPLQTQCLETTPLPPILQRAFRGFHAYLMPISKIKLHCATISKAKLERIAHGHYRGQHWGAAKTAVENFVDIAGDKVLIGVYRASQFAPAQVFYAHADHAHEAAMVVLADSVLQEHRGFPMLIDLADKVCRMMFGGGTFASTNQLAYADAGEPFRYMAERASRR
ncbi:MAG TPA: hypothetical protein VFC78_17195, partial [Tepidisphaeraceae bacterium]|nr:hypothetical protein [Tepidisphaeraceae bacterium]